MVLGAISGFTMRQRASMTFALASRLFIRSSVFAARVVRILPGVRRGMPRVLRTAKASITRNAYMLAATTNTNAIDASKPSDNTVVACIRRTVHTINERRLALGARTS